MVNTDKFLKPKLPEGKENKKEVKNMCWNGEPGKEGAVIVGRKEIVKNMARLSLTGNSERAISLYRAWSFLIPHYGPYTIKQPEVLLPQILEPALVNRYGHPWERVISIVIKNLEEYLQYRRITRKTQKKEVVACQKSHLQLLRFP